MADYHEKIIRLKSNKSYLHALTGYDKLGRDLWRLEARMDLTVGITPVTDTFNVIVLSGGNGRAGIYTWAYLIAVSVEDILQAGRERGYIYKFPDIFHPAAEFGGSFSNRIHAISEVLKKRKIVSRY